MKIIFHSDFYSVYASEPAAAAGRMEAIIESLGNRFDMLEAVAAEPKDIEAVHSVGHTDFVRQLGLYDIAALAAGGAIEAATIGLKEAAFAVIRPPGHHASRNNSWGFCYFNNMAVALARLLRDGQIKSAAILDFDLHHGDGTVDIFGKNNSVSICNPDEHDRKAYLQVVESFLNGLKVDIIGISAGFDNHRKDWGKLLETEDYLVMGRMVKETALRTGGGYFGILEGGYNHSVLGQNVLALIEGMSAS
jgi:acetoin utilization deacetylase AcuC-like enzyme